MATAHPASPSPAVSIAPHRHPFTALPNDLYGRVDHWGVAVIYSILWHGDREGCYESQARWAARLGMSVDRLQKTLLQLASRGLIAIEERWGDNGARLSNRYRWIPWELTPPADFSSHPTAASSGGPYRSERDPLPSTPAPPTAHAGTPYRCERYKQDSEEQDSDQQDSEELRPPLTPPCGGDGLTADQPSTETLSITVSVGQVEQPTAVPSDSPPASSHLAAQPQLLQQPNAAAPVKAKRSRTTRSSNVHSDDDARRLIAIWNENRPGGWGALSCMTAARWEVVDHWSAALGTFETFLQALPVALANAGRDRFWCAPGHGWNSFMGYGAKTGKAHFLTFLEQEQAYAPTVNRDGSLTFLGGVIQHSHNPTPKFF